MRVFKTKNILEVQFIRERELGLTQYGISGEIEVSSANLAQLFLQ